MQIVKEEVLSEAIGFNRHAFLELPLSSVGLTIFYSSLTFFRSLIAEMCHSAL
jgi:hypothetical protein